MFEQFGIVKPGTFWKLTKAVSGLRISPRLWGKERDKQLKSLRVQIDGEPHYFMSSSVDVALWILVADNDEEWDHNRTPVACLLTYVDDFMVVGPLHVRNAIEEEILKIWDIRVPGRIEQFDTENPDASVTFLSTNIRSHPT